MWWFVRNDAAEYAAFKRLTASADRQRCYGRWVLKSFLAFFGTSIVSLLILRQLPSLITLPAEFIPLAARLGAAHAPHPAARQELPHRLCQRRRLTGILIGVLLAKKVKASHTVLGDIEPLMPRNAAETGWAALLSLNAGLSEECFFRLLLPLLLAGLLHSPLLAFAHRNHPLWPHALLPGRGRRPHDDASWASCSPGSISGPATSGSPSPPTPASTSLVSSYALPSCACCTAPQRNVSRRHRANIPSPATLCLTMPVPIWNERRRGRPLSLSSPHATRPLVRCRQHGSGPHN